MTKIKKILKYLKKEYIIGFVVGAFLFGGIGVYAASRLYASSISIDTSKLSGYTGEANLQSALDALYTGLSEKQTEIDNLKKVGNATASQILSGKTALVGGKTITGTLSIPAASILKGKTVGGVSGTATSDATASASDIASGKTAYVNGSKITGTKSEIYFNVTSGGGKLYLQNRAVQVYYDSCGSYSNAICISWTNASGTTQTLAVAGLNSDSTDYYIDGTYQVSSNVILVYYHTTTNTYKENSTGTYDLDTYAYYLASYYINSSGSLTKADSETLTYSPSGYNYTSDLNDAYYSNSKIWNSRSISYTLQTQLFSESLDKTNKYLIFYEDMYHDYDHDTDSNDYSEYGLCMAGISVNRYSGAIGKGSYSCSVYKYIYDTGLYSGKTEWVYTKTGMEIDTYTNTEHSDYSSYTIQNVVGTSVTANSAVTTTSPGSSPLYKITDYPYGYQGDVLYALKGAFTFSRSGSVDTVSATLDSAPANSSSIFAESSTIHTKTVKFTISNIVPTSVSYKSQSIYYSPLTQKFYVTMTFSTGKLYLIFGVSQQTSAIDGCLTPSLESASYRSSENGSLLSTEQADYYNDKVIKYYK